MQSLTQAERETIDSIERFMLVCPDRDAIEIGKQAINFVKQGEYDEVLRIMKRRNAELKMEVKKLRNELEDDEPLQ